MDFVDKQPGISLSILILIFFYAITGWTKGVQDYRLFTEYL